MSSQEQEKFAIGSREWQVDQQLKFLKLQLIDSMDKVKNARQTQIKQAAHVAEKLAEAQYHHQQIKQALMQNPGYQQDQRYAKYLQGSIE